MQNKVNPLMLLLVLITLFLVSLIMLKRSNIEVKNLNNTLYEFRTLSQEYSSLKLNWGTKSKTLKVLDKIIQSSGIKNINKSMKNKKVIIKLEDNSIDKIDKFVNKILNNNFNILKLDITNNSVALEIGY